jgi:hypothetical protein
MRGKTLLIGLVGIVIGVLLSTAVVFAGSLNPSSGPGSAGSQMYTLQQIWDRLNNGAAATKMSAFTEPSTGPGSTMKTLDDLYTLASERSRPAKTRQTTCHDASFNVIACAGTGQDGELQKGVAWPNPRFTDNSNGTVTDNLTGLIWLKNANCFGLRNWGAALGDANGLASGTCGLTDGSIAGQWRLPNVRELQSIVHYGFFNPAVPNTAGTAKWTAGDPFTGVQSNFYWTSTTTAGWTETAWSVNLVFGTMYNDGKALTEYVWPVRGGQ